MSQANLKGQDEPDNFSEDQRKELLADLRNLPTLPDHQTLQSKNQSEILSKYFPWGCKELTKFRYSSFQKYQVYNVFIKDFSNLCIGIKYGICPFFSASQFKWIQTKFEEKDPSTSFYIKLTDENHVYALARVTKMNPKVIFKYWHLDGRKCYGIALIQVVAVGEGDKQLLFHCRNIKKILQELELKEIKWIDFQVSQDFEWKQRMKYIDAVLNGKYKKLIKALQRENKEMVEGLAQQ